MQAKSSVFQLSSTMPAVVTPGPGFRQEPGTHSVFPIWLPGTHILAPSPAISQDALRQQAAIESTVWTRIQAHG